MICCGHILSNPYKEEEFPDPGRLAMNRRQRAEEMCNIGNYKEYVPTSLIVLQRYPGIERQILRSFVGMCCLSRRAIRKYIDASDCTSVHKATSKP